jgi:hypothetical protein
VARGADDRPAIVVHPASDLTYASFVLEGLARVLGPKAITYSGEGFSRGYVGGRLLAFYLAEDPKRRCFLSLTDQTTVNPAGRKWAGVYGATNVESGQTRDPGVIPLGPTFGVRLRSDAMTMHHLWHTWQWGAALGRDLRPPRKRRLSTAITRTRAIPKHQRRRTTIDAYVTRPSEPDYLFFTAWPWAKHPEVNPPRIAYVEACQRAPGLVFEGGFAPRRRRDVPEVLAMSARSRYPIDEYLAKVGRSVVVFNNPAVHHCLGWKLGEFLALGKAIISLPLDRALPAPLEHGVHMHVIDGSPASFDDALDRLRRDHGYRRTLEINARQWYLENLEPARLAQRLLGLLGV